MANKLHLAILQQGVKVWNRWRIKHSEKKADLGFANLRGANLRGMYLGGAYLNWADLRGADLRGTDLGEADLRWAKYNDSTLFPKGFDPQAAGMVLWSPAKN